MLSLHAWLISLRMRDQNESALQALRIQTWLPRQPSIQIRLESSRRLQCLKGMPALCNHIESYLSAPCFFLLFTLWVFVPMDRQIDALWTYSLSNVLGYC